MDFSLTYLDRKDITPAAAHAAKQLLLRIKYLVVEDNNTSSFVPLDRSLVTAAKQVVLNHKIHSGTQPRADIFDRAVVRSGQHTYANALRPLTARMTRWVKERVQAATVVRRIAGSARI